MWMDGYGGLEVWILKLFSFALSGLLKERVDLPEAYASGYEACDPFGVWKRLNVKLKKKSGAR
jgi:hypothetical protein